MHGGVLSGYKAIASPHQLLESAERESRRSRRGPKPIKGGRHWRCSSQRPRRWMSTRCTPYFSRKDGKSAGHSVQRSPARILRISRTGFILRLSHRRAEVNVISGRRISAAASWLGAWSATLTACSTSSKVPEKREGKKSGNRLMVHRFTGQYHLATRQCFGNCLGYVPCLERPHPPSL